MESLFDFSLEVTRWLQTTYPQLEGFFRFITQLGLEEFYLALFPLIYWSLDKRLGKHIAYMFLLSLAFNSLFKHALRGPRPFWLDNRVGLDVETSYGIPSGHTQLASVVYLFLAMWFKRRWIWILALFMVVAMGLSRIYLGVHFVHDVLAGILLAILLLIGHVIWQRRYAAPFDKRILGQRLLVALVVPIALTLVYTAVRFIIGQPDPDVAWADFIEGAERSGVEAMATAVGTLLGMGIGIILERSRVRFLAEGPAWKRIVRYVVGMIVTVALWAGLKAIFPEDPLWLAIPLRILRYFLTLFWVGYYAPIVFVRLRLAEAEPDPGINLKM